MACVSNNGALQNAARLQEIFAAVLEHISKDMEGFAITELDRRVVYSGGGVNGDASLNPFANSWVEERNGALRGFDADDENELERGIQECAADKHGRAVLNVMRHRMFGPVHASITRVPVGAGGACLLFRFVDPVLRRRPRLADVRRWTGMSEKVAEVAVNLIAGASTAETANRRNVKVSTISSQLKAAFKRSLQHSQASLAMLLTRLAAI